MKPITVPAAVIAVTAGCALADHPGGAPADRVIAQLFFNNDIEDIFNGITVPEILDFTIDRDGDVGDDLKDNATLRLELLAKAEPDNCTAGVGEPNPPFDPANDSCPDGTEPLNADSSIVGIAKRDEVVYYGTQSNALAVTYGQRFGLEIGYQTPTFINQFGESSVEGGPFGTGDFLPPKALQYDLNDPVNIAETDLSTFIRDNGSDDDIALLNTTLRLNGVAVNDDVLIFAGPSITEDAVNVFTFNPETEEFVTALQMSEFDDISQGINVNGEIYFGVSYTTDAPAVGAVVRFDGTAAAPSFLDVAAIDGNPRYLAHFQDRLAVASDRDEDVDGNLASVSLTATFSDDGVLDAADFDSTLSVNNAADYEPDPTIALGYRAGALAEFDQQLYFSYNFLPGENFVLWNDEFGDNADGLTEVIAPVATYRSAVLLRGELNDSDDFDVELLHGENYLPANATDTDGESIFVFKPTGLGEFRFGRSGFGNFFVSGITAMHVYQDRLFVTTFDSAFTLALAAKLIITQQLTSNVPIADTRDAQNFVRRLGRTIVLGYFLAFFDDIWLDNVPDPDEEDRNAFPFLITPFDLVPNGALTPGADVFRQDNPDYNFRIERVAGLGDVGNDTILAVTGDEEHGLFFGTSNNNNRLIDEQEGQLFDGGGYELINAFRVVEGDTDGDGDADLDDLFKVLGNLGKVVDGGPADGDVFPVRAGDGRVDSNDYSTVFNAVFN